MLMFSLVLLLMLFGDVVDDDDDVNGVVNFYFRYDFVVYLGIEKFRLQ